MIHILFVSGAFGSMIEWGLRNYSTEYAPVDADMLDDGSMHTFDKMYHPLHRTELEQIPNLDKNTITTVIYPMRDFHAEEIINFINQQNDPVIFVSIPDIDAAEKIMLMSYYKIALGLSHTIGMFGGNNQHNLIRWNSSYTHWSQMKPWELRESLSLFYYEWVQEWIDAKDHVDSNWYVINPICLTGDYSNIIKESIIHCGLTYRSRPDLDLTISAWCSKQQEIFQQHETIKQIVENTINNIPMVWDPLDIISESFIQRRLRTQGYDIKCYNLDQFPRDSSTLHGLLEFNGSTTA